MADFLNAESRSNPVQDNDLLNFVNQEKEKNEKQIENYNRYGVEASDEEYEVYNKVLDRYPTLEEKQDMAYRIGCAKRYQDMYGIDFQTAWDHIDEYNQALFQSTKDNRTAFEAVSDALTIGNNNFALGNLGNKLREANLKNDKELADLYWKEIQTYDDENEKLQDKAPASWFTGALEAGAQSLPYTLATSAAAIFGNFIAPGAGAAASFGVSSYLTAGQEYIDILKNGGSTEAADLVSLGSGILQGLVEADFGITAAIRKEAGKAIGKEMSQSFLDKALADINDKAVKRFHFGPARKMLLAGLEEYGKDLFSEGNEEFWQEIISKVGQEIAASMDGYDIPNDDIASIAKDLAEQWKGGVEGAFTLGLLPTGLHLYNTHQEFKAVHDAAEKIDSEKMYDEVVKNSPVFTQYENEQEKAEAMHTAYTKVQNDKLRGQTETRSTEEIKTTNKAHEGYEEASVDDEGEAIPQEVYRENGKLYSNDVMSDDGKSGSFRVGDASKKDKNTYANIEYDLNEDDNTVTIKEFSVASHREDLRQEIFDDYAKEHAGQNIVWNDEKAAATIQQLSENNPRGKNKGLNYYAYSEDTDNDTRKFVLQQIDKYVPYKLDTKEKTQLLGYINTLSGSSNKVFTELYENMTGGRNSTGNLNELFGNAADAEAALNKDNHTLENKKGFIASNAATLTKDMRSVIYVGKNGDFGTLIHEILHAATPFLSDDIKKQMEDYIGKPMDQWDKATDGEVFTRALEDYIQHGITPNEKVRPLLDELTKTFVKFKHYLDDYAEVSPEIQKIFDKLLETDDSTLATAERAVNEYEQEQRAKAAAQVKENQKIKTETEQTQDEKTLLKKDTVETQEDQINAELDASPIPTGTAEHIAEVLNDPSATHAEKTQQIQWAADAEIKEGDALYQVIHAAAIMQIRDLDLRIALAKKLEYAQKIEKQRATRVNEDPAYTMKLIKAATGWEKVKGSWTYETNEANKSIHLNNGISENELVRELQQTPDKLVQRSTANKFTLQDVVTDEEVYKMFPSIAKIPFSFHNDATTPKINITKQGVGINLRRIDNNQRNAKGLKSVFAQLMQYLIQEKEGIDFNETMQLQEKAQREYNKYKRLSAQAALNDIMGREIDLDSLKQAYEAISDDVKSMESYTVARRILKDQDTSSLFSEDLNQTKMFFDAGIQENIDELTNPVKISHQESVRNVREKYEGTERWLKAPNGKDTNLTEEQWLQVRTPEFKNWFGDWENYPETASKILDENGEPLVVYHGTNHEFTVFDTEKWNSVYGGWGRSGQGFYFAPTAKDGMTWAIEAVARKGKYPLVMSAFLNIRNPFNMTEAVNLDFDKSEILKDTPEDMKSYYNKYGYRFMELLQANNIPTAAELMKMGYDGVWDAFDNIPTKSVEILAFQPTQIKSATDNNGDFDPTNANILYSTTERLFSTDQEKEAAIKEAQARFAKDPDGEEINKTMDAHRWIDNNDHSKGETGYYNMMIATGLIERDFDLSINRDPNAEFKLPANSWIQQNDDEQREADFNDPKKNKDGKWKTIEDVPHTDQWLAVMKGEKGLLEYLDKHKLIGDAAKPGHALNGSLKHCRPSDDCAKFCYVVSSGAKYTLFTSMFKSELVNWYVENHPEEAAQAVFAEWFKNIMKPLRIFDKGDLNEQWVKFVNKFNSLGGITQIFSKRPDLLMQLDPLKNRLLLSIDQTNRYLVDQYPQFDMSFLFNGKEDLDFVRKYGYRIGVILPLNSKDSKWTFDDIREAKKIQIDAKKAMETFGYDKGKTVAAVVCPHELLSKDEKSNDKAACQHCWIKKIGCYWKTPIKPIYKNNNTDDDLSYADSKTIINTTRQRIGEINGLKERFYEEAKVTPEQRRIFEELFGKRFEQLNTALSRANPTAILSELQGPYDEVSAGHDGTTGLEDTHYQTTAELDKEYLDAVISGDMEKAHQLLNQKASEALQAGATFTYNDDDGAIAYKLHRTREPYGSYDYKKEGPLTLQKIIEHNKKHEEIKKWNGEHPDQKKTVPTLFVYKTLGFDTEGGSHATYAGVADQIPWLSWLDAQAIKPVQSPRNGGWYIPSKTGINNTDLGLPGPKEGGSSKWLSFRPAFHSGRGAYPGQMRVIYKTAIDEYNKLHKDNPITPDPVLYSDQTKSYMLPSKLMAVVEIPGENDYQATAERYATALKAKTEKWYEDHPEIKRRKSNPEPRAQIPFTPNMGYYTYNNQGEEWVLAGQWKQHRLLTLDEIRQINEADGIQNEGETTLNWPAGYNMEEYGFNPDGTKKLPDQIKIADVTYDDNGDVIPLSDRFDVNNADARYQIIGEEGAQRLDDYYDNYYLLEEKQTAVKMEAAGKTAKEIRIATGWERGVDNKWRYEIPDLKIKPLNELHFTRYPGVKGAIINIKDLIDDPELFAAYPELNDVEVIFSDIDNDNTLGQWEKNRNVIRLQYNFLDEAFNEENIEVEEDDETGERFTYDYNNTAGVRSTLVHEIQHFIQDQENFERGGSDTEEQKDYVISVIQRQLSLKHGASEETKMAWERIKKAEITLQERRYEADPSKFIKSSAWQQYGPYAVSKNRKERAEQIQQALEKYLTESKEAIFNDPENLLRGDSYSDKTDEELKEVIQEARKRLDKYSDRGHEYDVLKEKLDTISNLTNYEVYRRLAGEVEARNTQNRLSLFPEERKSFLLSQTADVDPEQQIILLSDPQIFYQDTAAILYQTREDLMNDARQYENWQDFMDDYEMRMTFNVDEPERYNQVPANADAQWFQSTWETAKGLITEESLNEQEVKEKHDRDPQEQQAQDAMFTTAMSQDPQMLDDFLIRVAEIEGIDLDDPQWQQAADETDEAERKRIELLQDFIGTQLSHGNWLSNAQRVRSGNELTQGARNRILGLIRSNPRSYRAIYSEIMDDDTYAVPEEDTMAKQLAGKLKRYKLVSPDEDIERINPERMKKLADLIDNIEVQAEIKNGSMKMDDRLTNYIASINKELRDSEREYNELEKETQADYQRIADAETRDLLRLQQSLIKARAELDKKNKESQRLLNKGLKISSKYSKDAQNLKANYDEIFRKYKDLESVVRIDATVQAALERQRKLGELRGRIDNKKVEADTAAEIQKLRVQLVKRVMRRVPFDKIDYDNARRLIVLQRMFEPNLMGDINRWLMSDGIIVRNAVANILTDDDYKQQVMSYLKHTHQTPGLVDFIELLNNTKSIEQYDRWTTKQKNAAKRYLPKENWIKELNLKKLAEEREQSIDLDIGLKETKVVMKDKNGHTIIDPATGEARLMSAWEIQASQELKDLLKDTVGDEMYHNIMHRPFAEWTTDEMIRLATLVNNLYVEGRDQLAAKRQQQIEEAAQIRRLIDEAIKNTGIVINDDDDKETKERKQKKINKILGLDRDGIKGTEAAKKSGISAKINRLLHGYVDANVRRVARLLDNQSEGINSQELYWKENEVYTAKQKQINARAAAITSYMKDHNITIEDLAKKVKVGDMEFTVDELLYFLAADQDYAIDEKKVAKNVRDGNPNGDVNDDYAATSRNAVMFGNMYSRNQDQAQKQAWATEDQDMQQRIDADNLTAEERQLQAVGELITRPGTASYIAACKARYAQVLAAAKKLDPKYLGLLDVVQKDYAEQYERMNEASIKEFNIPVGRVKNYVPLLRLESNGDTNYNQVKEDLLATMGGNAGKQWVNKGMTQRRVEMSPLHQKPVQTGLYKTWSNSVERTEHFIAYAPYVRELNRVYKSRDAEYTRRFIENRYGREMLSYLDDYINEVANPTANKVRTQGDELLRTLRGKTAPAYLAWKASAIIKQGATSPWPFTQFVTPAEYIAASWKCITSRGAMYDAIKKKSVFMAQRVMDPMNDLIDEMEEQAKNKFERGLASFNKKGMAGLEWIDWVCVAPGWLACYNKKLAEVNKTNELLYQQKKAELEEENSQIPINTTLYMSPEKIETLAQAAMLDPEKEAIDYADDCTRLCQPSSRSTDISPLFKNSGEFAKAYLQFQTSLNVIWQNIRYDIPYYAANIKRDTTPDAVKKEMFARITGTIIGYVIAGIFMNSIMSGYPEDDDDDKDKLQALKEGVYYATTQFTDSVPLVGSAITNTAEKVITGKSTYTTNGTDMTPMLTKVLNTVKQTAAGNYDKAAEQFTEGLMMNLGLPVSGTKEILKEAGIDIGNKDFTPGLDLNSVYGIIPETKKDE